MSTQAGPNISVNPVINIDINNPQSFKGAITSNLITSNPEASSVTGYTSAGASRVDAGTLLSYDSKYNAVKWEFDTYQSWGAYMNNNTTFNGTLDNTKQYTMSFDWRWDGQFTPTANLTFQLIQGNGVSGAAGADIASNSTSISDGWKRFSYTFIPANTGVSANPRILIGQKTTGTYTKFWWKNLQLEQQAFRSNFISGSRSNSHTETASNLSITPTFTSYSNSGQPVFGGVSDKIVLPSVPSMNANNFSIEFIMRIPSLPSSEQIIVCPSTVSGDQYISINSSGQLISSHTISAGQKVLLTGPTLVPNQYYHVMYVRDATTKKFYINGSLITNVSDSTVYTQWGSSVWSIGNKGVGLQGYFLGEMPIFQVYNNSLTDNQVKQNFAAKRGKYSI